MMGTEFRVLIHAADSELAAVAARAAFDRASELNGMLSDYLSDSEVRRLASSAGTGQMAPVGDDLWNVLSFAQKVARSTGGAFDVTVGSITRLWRHSRRRGEPPSQPQIMAALAAVGYNDLQLDSARQSVRLDREGMRIDLGGIAKGYTADEMLRTIRSFGIGSALVDAGGDIAVGDAPPGTAGWTVEISGVDGMARVVSENHLVANAAVATSGDMYRFLEAEGVRYSHIVDPRTGLGLTERRLATVVARSGMQADAIASAVSVMGHQGLELACDRPGVAIRLIELGDSFSRASDAPGKEGCETGRDDGEGSVNDWFGKSQLASVKQ